MDTPKVIDCFDGEYAFLSNFYPAVVHFGLHTFLNSEAAFQAQKCISESEMRQFCDLPPGKAKRLGRKVQLRKDWENIKDDIMYEVVRAKFLQHPALAQQLLDTRDAELIEGNTWGDRYWGAVDGIGKNMLGRILMRIRSELPNMTVKIIDIPMPDSNGRIFKLD